MTQDLPGVAAALVARGLVDPARVATMGWSNGAILSAALLTRNPTYKAASLGAGGAEWVGDWGACEFGCSFSNYYFGKSPIEDPQLYIKMAPLYQFDKVRTPTILFHGTEDRAVPTVFNVNSTLTSIVFELMLQSLLRLSDVLQVARQVFDLFFI